MAPESGPTLGELIVELASLNRRVASLELGRDGLDAFVKAATLAIKALQTATGLRDKRSRK